MRFGSIPGKLHSPDKITSTYATLGEITLVDGRKINFLLLIGKNLGAPIILF